tara:strand:- start:956 stop:1522 length:567 start_codon:yes stop_codon:yes gene_type:complete
MPKYIKPKLSFSSKSEGSSTDPGPMSIALAMATNPNADASGRLTVGNVEQRLIKTSTTLNQDTLGATAVLADGYALMTAGGGSTWPNDGTVGAYIYMKNHSTTTGEMIYIAIVSNCEDNSGATAAGNNDPRDPDGSGDTALDETTHETLRTFTLLPGEFAFFPWDYTGQIHFRSKTGNPLLEYWRFEK